MKKTHEFEITINGETIKWQEKSHAQIFRNFWTYFMEKDLQKTIHTIKLAGIRTSDKEYFVAKNGGKKKNIHVKDDLWVYTHMNPEAMERVYKKFINGWEKNHETMEIKTSNDESNQEFELEVPIKNDEIVSGDSLLLKNKEKRQFIQDEVLTTPEAIELLEISRARLSKMIKDGKITPAKKLGCVSLFWKGDVIDKKKELVKLRKQYRPFEN